MQAAFNAGKAEFMDPYECHVFMFLLSEGIVDMAGYTSKRLMGVQWERCVPFTNFGTRVQYAEDMSLLVKEEESLGVKDILISEIQPPFSITEIEMSRPKQDGTPFVRTGNLLLGIFALDIPGSNQAEFCKGGFFPIDGQIKVSRGLKYIVMSLSRTALQA